MTTTLTFPGLIPGNNGKSGLLRMHWAKKTKLRDAYTWQVRRQTKARHPGPVKLLLVRYSSGCEMDYDNLVATGKLIFDAIVNAKVLPDDSQSVIAAREYIQIKCPRLEQRTVITITDL